MRKNSFQIIKSGSPEFVKHKCSACERLLERENIWYRSGVLKFGIPPIVLCFECVTDMAERSRFVETAYLDAVRSESEIALAELMEVK